MNKEREDNSYDLDNYISGIYNYCDRWCERCPLRDKCFLYAREQKRLEKHREKGEDPHDWDVVMEDVKEDFDETLKLLQKAAEEEGIDLDDLPDVEIEEYDPSDHPLLVTAHKYSKKVRDFLEKLREAIEKEGVDLTKRIDIIPDAEEDIGTLRNVVYSYEVIVWFHTFIPVKIHRALKSKMDTFDEEFSMSDANGSAKIAHIGVMESMNALKAVYNWDEDLKDDALSLLAELEKIHKSIEKELPDHHSFKRPGFDDLLETD